MSDARRYVVWPELRSRSLKGSRPSVPYGTNFSQSVIAVFPISNVVIFASDHIAQCPKLPRISHISQGPLALMRE